ncbi:MAG TPA: XRE family transcriptional regulator [Gammaproteobacteria bacterium]|nr:XRE family transcriptional regulator [Gammaproteobacteria bacterium]
MVGEPERPPYDRVVSEAARRLAGNIRLLRTVHGWSQETLALNAGLDRTFVGAVERAKRNITLASAEKLAHAFELTVADLRGAGLRGVPANAPTAGQRLK